jgi:hypothetical protein
MPPEFFSSAILVRTCNTKLLVTTAHSVQDASEYDVYIPAQDGLQRLDSKGKVSSHPNSGLVETDPYDLAVIRLREECVQQLPLRYSFYPYPGFVAHVLPHVSSFVVAGFPCKRQIEPYRARNEYETELWVAGGLVSVHPKAYLSQGLSMERHIAMRFDRRKLRFPKLIGMSGGGLFALSTKFRGALLVGVTIEYRKEHQMLVATLIDGLVEPILALTAA